MQIYCGGRRGFSGSVQVDAAAKVDGGEVLSNGDGARAAAGVARGRRRRRRKDEKHQVVPIYKGLSKQAGAKIEEDPNNDYLTKRTPRFSEGIKG